MTVLMWIVDELVNLLNMSNEHTHINVLDMSTRIVR
jgi:hypothetical protein